MSSTGDFYSEHIWKEFSEEDIIDTREYGGLDKLSSVEQEAIRGGRVLDAGCGTGRRCLLLDHHDPDSIFAFDIAQENVLTATTTTSSYIDSDFHAVQSDVLNVPIRSESFDYVLCNGVLHHTPDPRAGFRELERLLKPGGVLRIGLYHPAPRDYVVLPLRKILRPLSERTVDLLLRPVLWRSVTRKVVLDHLKVPIRHRFTTDEIETWFEESSLTFSSVTGNGGYRYYVGRRESNQLT